MSCKTTVVDKGWNATILRSLGLDDKESKVGYPADETFYNETGELVVTIATVHEFGAPKKNIPQRSHVRSAYDEGISDLTKFAAITVGKVIDGKLAPEQAIKRLGEYHAAQIRKKIKEGPFVALSDKTVERKGSDKPLIDTAHMIQSVTHVES